MSIVWIPKDAAHGFAGAEKRGKLRFIFDDTRDLFSPDQLLSRAEAILQTSAPDDFILLAGPAMMNIVAVQAMVRRHGKVRLLMFHSRDNDYRERWYNG